MAQPRSAISRGRGTKAELVGLREAKLELEKIAKHLTGERRLQVAANLETLSEEAAKIIIDEARANAQARGWPRDVIEAAFTYAPLGKSPTGRQSSLMGISTGAPPRLNRRIFVEFYSKTKGRIIGMSLARMFESGTSKMQPRPALRPALDAKRPEAIRYLQAGIRKIAKQLNDAPAR